VTLACLTRADEARLSVLRLEYRAQERALAARQVDLAQASDPKQIRSLQLSVAWHRDTLDRLAQHLDPMTPSSGPTPASGDPNGGTSRVTASRCA
jgi:hypothetical protein